MNARINVKRISQSKYQITGKGDVEEKNVKSLVSIKQNVEELRTKNNKNE